MPEEQLQEQDIESIDQTETVEDVDLEANEQAEEAEEKEPGYRDGLPSGYMDLEEWEAAGKPRDEWMSPKAFNDIGRFTQATNRLNQKLEHAQQKTSEEIANIKTYYAAQLKNKENEIIQRYNDAVEMGDVEAVNQISGEYWDNKAQIDQATRPVYNPQAEAKKQELEGWYNDLTSRHDGINVDMAIQTAMQRNQGANGVDVDAVMKEVNNYFKRNQPNNPRRNSPPVTTTSNKRTSSKLSIKDCTNEELAQLPFFYGDRPDQLTPDQKKEREAKFLNAVKTHRSQI